MTSVGARFGGVALALVVIAVGILIGRVIETTAVAAVLFAIWTSVRRLVAARDDGTSGGAEDRLA